MKASMKLPVKEIVATIKVEHRTKDSLTVTVNIPIWVSPQPCGRNMIVLTALGGIVMYAEKDEDVVKTAQAGIKAFLNIAEKFGKGLPQELELLGWQRKSSGYRLKDVAKNVRTSTTIPKSEYVKDEMPIYPQTMLQSGYNQTLSCVI